MKTYTDYMDHISADAALHGKIMERITLASRPPRRNRAVFRYAGLAACAAALLLCVWAFPGWFNAPAPIENIPSGTQDGPHGGTQGDQQAGQQTAPPPATTPMTTPAPDEIWPLTLNTADSQLAANIYIPGHFWYELTGEQLNAVFPNFPLTLTATANYRGDGSLYNIVAYEAAPGGSGSAVYNEYYIATMIEVIGAGGGSMEDVGYEYEPVVTNVWGVPVVAGVFDYKGNDGVALFDASFEMDGVTYKIHLHDEDNGDSGKNRLSYIVNHIIQNGAADLSVLDDPVIPELRDDRLTLEEARNDPDFGAYLPITPSRFGFESAWRFINQETNCLSISWTTGYDYIGWDAARPTAYDLGHIVYASEREKYDLSLYPVPRAESVPRELWEYVDNPVFPAEELTLDVVRARAYYVDDDRGDTPGWRVNFHVLCDGVVVRVNAKGASPEQVWDMFTGLAARN